MYKRLSAPVSVQWELTPWCNYSCTHCYNYWRKGAKPKKTLNSRQLEEYRRIAQEIVDNNVFHVTLTGGEPLGVLEQLFPILLLLKQKGVCLNINSNLALLNAGLLDILHQLGIKSVLTSLISADEGINDELTQRKGSFKRTVEGVKFAVVNGLFVSVNMVVSQKNFHTIYETGELAHKIGAKSFSATKAAKPANCDDFSEYSLSIAQLRRMFTELLRVREVFGINVASLEHYPACVFPSDAARTAFGGRNCSAAKSSCTIGFDGCVRPCTHAPMSYGSVAQEGLSKAWESMDLWREGKLVPAVCKQECGEFPNSCGGGCRIESLNANRSIYGTDPYSLGRRPETKRILSRKDGMTYDTRVALNSRVMFRPEDFGHIAYGSSSSWVAIDPALYNLLLTQDSFDAETLAHIYQCEKATALETLKLLRRKGIVRIV